ncbi:hypothetical protein MAR_026875 [Mya arenaria]|uniref:Uncharacterized protein n=1 Tax=Mya arenaria TaxID=6604 RepID=A0ABY7ERT0_MYAAR|nr:hypothetical protein MAR_026875 [Mya arenaria]
MIKFYCPTHRALGCGDCVVLDHRSCKVEYIPDVATDFVTGKEFRELEPSIKRAEDLLSGFISNVKELFGDVKIQSKVEIDKLRKFRAEINTYLDRREKELLDNIEKVKTEDENVLTALKTDCELMKTGLEAMRTELTSGDVSVNQLYVTARRCRKEQRGMYNSIKKMVDRMNARKYQFTKDADTERLLGSNMGLGTLDVAGEFRKNICHVMSKITRANVFRHSHNSTSYSSDFVCPCNGMPTHTWRHDNPNDTPTPHSWIPKYDRAGTCVTSLDS